MSNFTLFYINFHDLFASTAEYKRIVQQKLFEEKFTDKSSWKGERCSNIIVGAKMDNVVPTGPHIVWLVS